MDEILRRIAIALVERLPGIPKEELREMVDTIKFSDDAEELEQVLVKLSEVEVECSKDEELLGRAAEVISILASMVGIDPLELRTPRTIEEALGEIAELVAMGKERFECVEKDRIEKVKDRVLELIGQIGSRYKGPDTDIIIRSVVDRLTSEDKAIFSPEVYRRIQDLILEREKELEAERAKVREKLKVVIKSIVDSLNSLGESETAIVDSLNQHVMGIEDIIKLDNIDQITERLAQLSKDLRRTINRVKREIGRTRSELERTKGELETLRKQLEKYREQSIIDELTKVLNRRGIMDVLSREMARSRRFNTPLSVIILDIDDFKKVNDTYGHLVGDKVLQAVASIVKENLRATDVVGRYGGEEFLVVLPDTDAEGARVVAEKLRKAIEKKVYKYKDKTFKVTVSLGVAQMREGDTPESLINRADRALYLSKSAGKNRTTIGE